VQSEPTQKGGVGLLVGGALVALVALVVLGAGGFGIWADAAKRDGTGYFSANAHGYQTSTRAIATDDAVIGHHVPNWLIGKVQLKAVSAKEIFVGVARTSDVDAYLAGVAHTTAKDLDLDPFRVTYVPHPGQADPGRPADQTFWAASASGSEAPKLRWKVGSGRWSVVLMNADGSPGVSATVSAGIEIPSLLWAGIGFVSLGAALLGAATLMLVRGSKRNRRSFTAGTPAPAL
jgi:hypothetical protein